MKLRNAFLAVLSAAILIVGISAVLPVQTKPQPAAAQEQSDKYDGDCTGNETEGRCADKCPDGTFYVGEKEPGMPLCKITPTGCPYGDSIPLGPECDKHAPAAETNTSSITTATPSNQCGGGK